MTCNLFLPVCGALVISVRGQFSSWCSLVQKTVTVQTSELLRDSQSSCTVQCNVVYKVKLSPKRDEGHRGEGLVLIGVCQTATGQLADQKSVVFCPQFFPPPDQVVFVIQPEVTDLGPWFMSIRVQVK